MSKKQGTKKLLYAALAAIAGGGILYAVFKNREEDEKDTKKIKVGPSTGGTATGTDQDSTIDETITEGSGGGGGVGGGGGGGGLGEGLRMCLGLNEEAERDVKYVAEGEECPVEFPYDTEEQVEEAQYDAFRCYDIDENNELVEQEKALDEVCGVDYPDFPFESRNDALLYAESPSDFEGCTDPDAVNYNEEAIFDDGSCEMPVEGCMLEDALNFDPEANVEANDTCEFEAEAVLGCTSEEAVNFNSDATADDGSCQFVKTCWAMMDGNYQIYSTEVNLPFEGASCYDDLEPVMGDVGGYPVFRLGYYDNEEDAQAYLNGFSDEVDEIQGEAEFVPCYFFDPETGDVSFQEFAMEEGDSCSINDIGNLVFYDSEQEATQGYIDNVLSMQTQSCYSYDAQGTFILDDLPFIADDAESITDTLSCDDLGFFELSEGGLAEAEQAFQDEYVSEEQVVDFESEDDTMAPIDEEELEPTEEIVDFESEEEPVIDDFSPIDTGATEEEIDDLYETAFEGTETQTKLCYAFDESYQLYSQVIEVGTGPIETACYDNVEPLMQIVGGFPIFRLGWYDNEVDAQEYLSGFYGGATTTIQEQSETEDIEEDTSPLLTTEQVGTLQMCPSVPSDANVLILEAFGSTLTANVANQMLGYECFDPVTGDNLYYVAPDESLVDNSNEAVEHLTTCLGGPNFSSDQITNLMNASYPLEPAEFNDLVGFACLNAEGEAVGSPITGTDAEEDFEVALTEDEGADLVGDANEPPSTDPQSVLGARLPEEEEDDDDATSIGDTKEIREKFSNFVNSRNHSSSRGCTDPLAWNFNESATIDDGSCDY